VRRGLAALGCAALLALAGCGGDSVDPDTARFRTANTDLAKHPGDPRAQAHLIDVAVTSGRRQGDPVAGTYTKKGVSFMRRAAEVWPRYVASTRRRPDPKIAGQMALVFGDVLSRPREAAQAMLFVTDAAPSSAAYLRLAVYSARARDLRGRDLAGQKALELAGPGERDQVRQTIRYLRTESAP
jgi:hypothetical protein